MAAFGCTTRARTKLQRPALCACCRRVSVRVRAWTGCAAQRRDLCKWIGHRVCVRGRCSLCVCGPLHIQRDRPWRIGCCTMPRPNGRCGHQVLSGIAVRILPVVRDLVSTAQRWGVGERDEADILWLRGFILFGGMVVPTAVHPGMSTAVFLPGRLAGLAGIRMSFPERVGCELGKPLHQVTGVTSRCRDFLVWWCHDLAVTKTPSHHDTFSGGCRDFQARAAVLGFCVEPLAVANRRPGPSDSNNLMKSFPQVTLPDEVTSWLGLGGLGSF